MIFAFVILHYITLNDTVECIESIIESSKDKKYYIIIVDNASPNNSYIKLKEKYQKNENIRFIENTTNLGFAKGNNTGYAYAKKVLNADFVIMINNDTLIQQVEFLDLINDVYLEKNPYIIGPDIISTLDGSHQNPQQLKALGRTDIIKQIIREFILLLLNITRTEKYFFFLNRVFRRLTNINKAVENEKASNKHISIHENVVLHGACLIFTPLYITKYKGLFDDTFMYMEENILHYISIRENINMIYYPSINILHKEDVSTNALFKETHKKRIFVYSNKIKSAFILLKVMGSRNYYINNIIDI